ncbi:c-type cytochrome [Sulfurimonas sp. SAG-AH-194-I05]|nr:cytochrome c peroxidase [Sulfurimonas sp. SAG-AH-194-I05]MDF1875375.1 c-type cytochrome [Sulfurimonas sp. SAG-AH-194-I05]
MFKMFLILFISLNIYAKDEITPIPLNIFYEKDKASLGKKLFFDTILSQDGTLACVTCHQLPGSGADTQSFSVGINGTKTSVNTPTVLNARFNFSQFWDGRAKNLHEQALAPVINPMELGSSIEELIAKLNASSYKKEFKKLFEEGITKDTISSVIAEFEKALTTPHSRFDKYLRGDSKALNEQEKRGYTRFKELGCISCHNGVNIGGNMYQKFGIMLPYEEVIGGRVHVTGRERDRDVLKVPTLRNIALTAPYLHDGSLNTLLEIIADMKEHQLGIVGADAQDRDIEAFLKTLTGETPAILEEVK